MLRCLIPAVVCLLLSAMILICHKKGDGNGKFIFKFAASFAFLLEGFLALTLLEEKSLYGIGIVFALALGAFGDVFLCLDSLTGKKQLAALGLGGFCFLSGHILYIVLFTSLYPFDLSLLTIAAIFPAAVTVLSLCKVLKLKKLTLPVAAYSASLGLLIASGLNILLSGDSVRGAVVLSASILFAVSDICLGVKEFGNKRAGFLIYIVMPTYYLAQILFAFSILL